QSARMEDILMSSAAQMEANRRNAQLCTGPRTEAGKDASKLNALKHGLASTQVVLPYEDCTAFEDLKATLIIEHQPAGPTEQLLVGQLAESWWRSLRAHRVESEYLNRVIAAAPGDAALADAVIAEKDNSFAKIQRYVSAAERAVRNALAELRKAQQARYKQAQQAREEQERARREKVDADIREIMAQESAILRAARNGFVPQPQPRAAPDPLPLLENPPSSPAEAIPNQTDNTPLHGGGDF
ncbi:MAG TPA: hypothetical protein VKV15_22370, partial [Bryobacteraceae bacterium]|nr:hypothetical protein [Bryobacteraceae bacterium]